MLTSKIYIPLAVILFFLSGCTTIYNPATQKKEHYFIDENSEIEIGRNLASEIKVKNKILKDKLLQARLDHIGSKVALASDRSNLKYYFYIVDSDQMNAFALPGGYVFVNKGLIDKTTEDELAFVLGHEIGHISARHSLKRLQSSLGINFLLVIALGDSDQAVLRQAASITYELVALGYSRRDEFLADYLGLKYSRAAGYKPEAALSLFRMMAEEEKSGKEIVFLMSHPPLEKRIERAKKALKKANFK